MPPNSLEAWQDLFGADTRRQEEPLYDVRQRDIFGRTLRMLRGRLGLSQEHLGALIGMRPDALAQIEAGLLSPSLWRALDLATFFGVTVEAMCGRAVLPASVSAADGDEDDEDLA